MTSIGTSSVVAGATTDGLEASGGLRPLRFADLYAGIGGFHLAWQPLGAECVLAAESNPSARATYERNFAGTSPQLFAEPQRFPHLVEDIAPMVLEQFGVDVVCAGFPCQPFSYGGPRRGFMDPRGGAFFDLLRLLREGQPAAFVFENVQGLVTHSGGRTLQQMLYLLQQQIGYTVHHTVLHACDFGLPQLRPRVFLVGFREPSVAARFRFAEPIPLVTTLSDVLGGRCERQVAYTVRATWSGSGLNRPKAHWDAYVVDGHEHRLSVDEIRQLQGFPDGFWLPGRSTATRLLGNAVAVPVAQAVAQQMVAALRPEPERLSGTVGASLSVPDDRSSVMEHFPSRYPRLEV